MSNEQSIGDPVPLSEYPFQHPNPGVVSAFNQCRAAETRITNELESSAQLTQIAKEKLRKDLYHVRLAGYLLVFSLSDTQTAAVTTSIVSAENVVALGAFYDQYFVRTFRRTKSRTPQPSNHPSRPSFDLGADQLMDQGGLLPYPTTHSDAKKYALRRDNNRCMLSGKIHSTYFESLSAAEKEAVLDAGVHDSCNTECCHIFSESNNTNLGDEKKHTYAGNAWHLLATFGHPSILTELNGDKIHSLTNILTLEPFLHDWFDDLKLWLEPTETLNRYKIGTIPKARFTLFRLKKLPTHVEFQTPDAYKYPLPNPTYLRIHAACCKVAHMAGAAGYFELLEDDDQHDRYGPVPAGALMARLVDLTSEIGRSVEPV